MLFFELMNGDPNLFLRIRIMGSKIYYFESDPVAINYRLTCMMFACKFNSISRNLFPGIVYNV